MAKLNDKGKVEFERNDKIKTQELVDYITAVRFSIEKK
jgi:hypothetical protein